MIGVALLASAIITYTLVQLTSPGHKSGAAESTPVTPLSTPLSSVTPVTSPPTDGSTTPGPPSMTSTASSPPVTTDNHSDTSDGADGSETPESASSTSASAPPPTTATSVLDGSGVVIPAAWSGTAKVTVTVLGECAASTPSVYTDVPANLALDLTQNELTSAGPTMSTPVPENQPTLTLGVGDDGLPKIAVYSSVVDETGAFARYWDLTLAAASMRTAIHGTMLDTKSDGTNPNFLADSETSLQPCESAGTVSLPRVLAGGSTLRGWVTASAAELTLHATTTDGKRAVVVEFSADRRQ